MRVEGMVLEYTDETSTMTVPVSGANVSLFLPQGVEQYCGVVVCDIEIPEATTTDGSGGFSYTLFDPAACTLSVQAEVTRVDPLTGAEVRKTGVAPTVAPDCREGRVEGPTLVLEAEG